MKVTKSNRKINENVGSLSQKGCIRKDAEETPENIHEPRCYAGVKRGSYLLPAKCNFKRRFIAQLGEAYLLFVVM